MFLKIFIVVLINAIWALVPQNIIGCGPQPDPKDYYTSFFSNAHVPERSYRPFFYTALIKFYDDWDWDTEEKPNAKKSADALITEWQQYAGKNISSSQVEELVYKTPASVLQFMVDKSTGKRVSEPAEYSKYSKNLMATTLLAGGKKEAMEYLMFAKQVQQLTYTADPWEAPVAKDSVQLMLLQKKADMLRQQVKDAYLQHKYAFLQCRIAFYAGNYPLCIQIADTYFGAGSEERAVKPLAVGYKAGCYFKTGKTQDAALWFARAFKMSPENRKKNFLGFYWSTNHGDISLMSKIVSKGADNKEKAFMAAMFSIHGLEYGLETMKQVYSLDKNCELLPLLVVREIKKLEENFLSPVLGAQKGSGNYLLTLEPESKKEDKQHMAQVRAFLEKLAAENEVPQNEFYRISAAYTAYMSGDYNKAMQWATKANDNQDKASLKQQSLLISILSTVSKAPSLNAVVEAELLPSLQSLYSIAEKDMEYRLFMRNLYSQVLAPKYFAQGDIHKTALCLGVSNLGHMPEMKEAEAYYGGFGPVGIDFVRNELSTTQAIRLHDFLKANNRTAYERFLSEKTSFKKEDIIDFIGTSYLRDHAWDKAIEWLAVSGRKEPLIGNAYNQKTYEYEKVFVNPFYDYLNDWQRYEKPLMAPMDKLSLARRMLNLEKQFDSTTNKPQKGKIAYTLGSAYYNLSYYGNAWMALDYERSTFLWNNGKYTGWRKEYFEVQKARKYFQLAYELSAGNKEFQAASFFLVAKCVQRQIARPDYDYDNYNASDKAEKEFEKKFMNNPLFPQFKKEFGQTKYYTYALMRCSYLADFNRRK